MYDNAPDVSPEDTSFLFVFFKFRFVEQSADKDRRGEHCSPGIKMFRIRISLRRIRNIVLRGRPMAAPTPAIEAARQIGIFLRTCICFFLHLALDKFRQLMYKSQVLFFCEVKAYAHHWL